MVLIYAILRLIGGIPSGNDQQFAIENDHRKFVDLYHGDVP